LPAEVADALAIWTRIAGHAPDAAPGFMALVPALIHRAGAFTAPGGLAGIPDALVAAVRQAGVEVRLGTRVRAIHHDGRAVSAVETESGDRLEARLVMSNVGLSTYLSLLVPRVEAAARPLEALPLQSPGLCAYVVAHGAKPRAYLRFRRDGGATRVLVAPGGEAAGAAMAMRLIAPIAHETAAALGQSGQEERLAALVAEPWWRSGLDEVRVVARRVPATWGRTFGLHRDAMNSVMTPGLARRGRLAHRSPWVRGLYLAGSSTHPGQWVSFCCISGVLAAERAHADTC
jgi:phytoene dehydrogenase-like protein